MDLILLQLLLSNEVFINKKDDKGGSYTLALNPIINVRKHNLIFPYIFYGIGKNN